MGISYASPRCILCLALLLSISTASSSGSSPEPVAFFIFGDSTVDPGNNNYIDTVPGLKANYRPYGQSGYFNEPTGRFSDGRLLVDFIAEYAKLPITPPFLQPSVKFYNGANFASGGAGVLAETNAGRAIDLQTQLKEFEEVQRLLEIELGDEKTIKLIEEAVYFISIGSNDYMAGYVLNPHMRDAYSPDDFVEMVVSNLTRSIQELYEKGARKFGFLSLCPLGCLPFFRAANSKADGSCVEDISALALAHNNALSAVLISLNYILKGFKYANIDVYNWLSDRIHHPSEYGFKDGINACCGTGAYRGIYSCGGNKEVTDYEVCETPEDHVWWDSIHSTERIYEQIAKTLWSDPPSTMGPYNLEGLFFSNKSLRIDDIVDDQEGLGEFGSIA